MSTDDTRTSDGQGLSEEEREALGRIVAEHDEADQTLNDWHPCSTCPNSGSPCPCSGRPWLGVPMTAAINRILVARGGNTDNGLRAAVEAAADHFDAHLGHVANGQNPYRELLDAAPAPTETCRCRVVGQTRDPYEPHIPAQAEWEQADDCPVHPLPAPAPTDNQRDNGLAERDVARRLHAMACEDNPAHADWTDCAGTGPCRDEGRRFIALRAVVDGATTGDGEEA